MRFAARLLLGVALCAFHALAAAQTENRHVAGVINDALGRPLAQAHVSLTASDGKVIGTAETGPDGRFSFDAVMPGTYAILVDRTGFRKGTTVVTVGASEPPEVVVTMASEQPLEVRVAAERLDIARNALSPRTGSSQYSFDERDIRELPEGEDTSFNQVLLQAPGVANDSFGQLHIRGDHANVQYRLNNIIVPEGISGFGQTLDTRFARRIDLLTGALPAQYGYRTAGVVEIETKNAFDTGGRVGIYGGSHETIKPSAEYGGTTSGGLNYYLNGSYLHSNLGIENPTASNEAIHDRTDQGKGFAYLSKLLDSTTRLSFIAGTAAGHFQIPNNPGQMPDPGFLAAAGVADFDSATLNETQREVNTYAVLAMQKSLASGVDYQVALFSRYSSVEFNPDPVGDLVFNGVASKVFRSSFTNGLQFDASNRLSAAHTLRMGANWSTENDRSDNTSTVFMTDATGAITSGPVDIVDNNNKKGNTLVGLYLQDEWHTTDTLTVNYGARIDRMDAFTTASQLSPRLGAVYKPTSRTTLHVGYSRYFTPPPNELLANKSLDLFANTTNAPEVALNSPVQPERTHYFDAGVNGQVTQRLNLGIDGYYKRVSQLLDEGQFGQALIFTPFNYDKAKIYGVEFTANYRDGNFSAYGNLARSVARATDITSAQFNFGQDELDYISKNYVNLDHDQTYTASAGTGYTWLGTRYTADLYYGSGLRRGFANTEKLPPYTNVNAGLVHRYDTFSFGKVDFRLAVVNVFDKSYEIRDGTGIGVGAPQFGPRRSFYAGLAKVF